MSNGKPADSKTSRGLPPGILFSAEEPAEYRRRGPPREPESPVTARGPALEEMFGTLPDRLEVDIGCGKGRFLVTRAAGHPDISFLGIDRRKKRSEKTARKVAGQELSNIRVLCAEAYYVIANMLPAASVSTYYLFFPDPWPKRRHHRRRLFDAVFMDALARTMKNKGRIHVITDHHDYFDIIRGILAADPRFSEIAPFMPETEERTEFYLVFLKKNTPLHACSFEKSGGCIPEEIAG